MVGGGGGGGHKMIPGFKLTLYVDVSLNAVSEATWTHDAFLMSEQRNVHNLEGSSYTHFLVLEREHTLISTQKQNES